jgi:hypothetical protein
MKARFAFLFITVAVIFTGSAAFASNDASKTATLVVNVTVQQVIGLNWAAGAPCTVAAYGGNYSVNFGNMEPVMIDDRSCSGNVAPSTPGSRTANVPTTFSKPSTLMFVKSATSHTVLTRYTRASSPSMDAAELPAVDSTMITYTLTAK